MSDERRSLASRRAYLAASLGGVTSLAGCPSPYDRRRGVPTETETPTETATPTETPQPTVTEPATVGKDVLVDQVGYRPGDEKVAVVRTPAEAFDVVDVDSRSVVESGELGDEIDDESSGDTVRQADFSDLSTPGTYALRTADGSAGSYTFTVDEGVYGEALAATCRAYTLRRSNTEIDDDVTGLELRPGHTQDSEAKLYFSDEFHDEGEQIDVAGGWYDAADYGKYVPLAAVSVAQMLLAHERNPAVFESGQLGIDAALADETAPVWLPGLLAETRFELEWLEKMQREDGAVYHKVAGTEWPSFAPPAADTQQRYVFGLSTFGTAQFAGAMALAARVYEEYDPAFASRALENAEAAWSFLLDNPEPYFRHDEGQNGGSSSYRNPGTLGDAGDRFWAAAELLKTTGESQYADYLEREHADQFSAKPWPVEWYRTFPLGQWAYYTADAAAPDRRSSVEDAILAYADSQVQQIRRDGYNVALTEGQYYWGSTRVAIGEAVLLLVANAVEADEAYVDAALDQVHYVLGRTPTTRSYVTGVGKNPPEHPHDRISASADVTIPGYLVGGPNKDGGDPVLDEYIESEQPPPAKAYVDDQGAFAANSVSTEYSAPLVFALSHFTVGDAVRPQADDE
ncbi:endoglucanase [Halomicrobium zhouii]|uniref:Endoglucanase n=1 Tax=Halomicrobium zhouii TaxID=767519 RepID=A0A1I6KAW8_9EURY|nr:glycoside hydrolase family 9 protein [Halomicrobium zhouii]SFR88356.1 endoglucanase [Halomicrobium zhouii]